MHRCEAKSIWFTSQRAICSTHTTEWLWHLAHVNTGTITLWFVEFNSMLRNVSLPPKKNIRQLPKAPPAQMIPFAERKATHREGTFHRLTNLHLTIAPCNYTSGKASHRQQNNRGSSKCKACPLNPVFHSAHEHVCWGKKKRCFCL